MVAILGFSLFAGCGSQSSDISGVESVENPLPPCPGSPNCIRITKQLNYTADSTFAASKLALQEMGPESLTAKPEQWKLETVFRLFLFRDDMVLQVTEKDSISSYLHIRSASRVGESDLGVNRRRVRTFLDKLETKLPESSDSQ